MRFPFVSRRYARGAVAVATAGLRADLEATQAELAEVRTAARVPETAREAAAEALAADLRKQVKSLLASVDQLRRGVPDTAQIAELRRLLGTERRVNRALEQRLYEMTLANQLHDQQVHDPKETGE